jgi:hypothetical protein
MPQLPLLALLLLSAVLPDGAANSASSGTQLCPGSDASAGGTAPPAAPSVAARAGRAPREALATRLVRKTDDVYDPARIFACSAKIPHTSIYYRNLGIQGGRHEERPDLADLLQA